MSNNRILKFAAPSANAPPATLVVGQADFVSNAADRGGAAAANTLDGPIDISILSAVSLVADYRNNRVLLLTPFPLLPMPLRTLYSDKPISPEPAPTVAPRSRPTR